MYDDGDVTVVKFVSGQKAYVDATIVTRVSKDNHQVAMEPFYNANGIDLRQNAYSEFGKRRALIVKKTNEERKKHDMEANTKLLKDIIAHNRANPKQTRDFKDEKIVSPKIGIKNIAVTFSKLSFKYTPNPFISFDDVIQIIFDVNGLTQGSPLP
jgi:hypothetical protein